MSLQETYQSRKELIAENLMEKGISADATEGLTTLANKILDITATEFTETVIISVEFNDGDNQDGVRPTGITGTFRVNNDGFTNFTLNDANSWSTTLTNIPEGTYTVNIDNINYYTKTDASSGNFFKYVFTHEPATRNINAQVVFNDNGNAAGGRPGSVVLYLLKNGEVYKKQTVSAASTWKHTFTNLPTNSNPTKAQGAQTENLYDVQCVDIPVDYTCNATGNASDGFLQTFTINSSNMTIRTTFSLDEGDYNGNEDPMADVGNATFTITGQDSRMPMTVTYSQFTNGLYELQGLLPGTYGVICQNALSLIEGGTLANDSTIAQVLNLTNGSTGTSSLYLHYNPTIAYQAEPEDETVDIPVTIIWSDNDNSDLNRPDSVTVRLYAGGTEADSAVITENDGWAHTFSELPKYLDEHEVTYTINEDPVEWYMGNKSGFTITNVYQPELTALTVKKVWNDDDNALGRRPSSIAMMLSNGSTTVATLILNEENGWAGTVSGLPTKFNGESVTYTWAEQDILGYIQENLVTNGSVTTFTNVVWSRPENPVGPKVPGNTDPIFEEYDTPL